jgi:hypothetical protein
VRAADAITNDAFGIVALFISTIVVNFIHVLCSRIVARGRASVLLFRAELARALCEKVTANPWRLPVLRVRSRQSEDFACRRLEIRTRCPSSIQSTLRADRRGLAVRQGRGVD